MEDIQKVIFFPPPGQIVVCILLFFFVCLFGSAWKQAKKYGSWSWGMLYFVCAFVEDGRMWVGVDRASH